MEDWASAVGRAGAVWSREWVIVRRLCRFWPWPPADARVWNSFWKVSSRWSYATKTKKKIISPYLIQNFFSTIFRTLLSLPPNYTALLTTSYSRWLWVLIKYSYMIKIRQKWQNCFSQNKTPQKQTNTEWCMFHTLHPCHLVCTSQLGRTWLMPVGSVTIATTRFFFFLSPRQSSAACFLQ